MAQLEEAARRVIDASFGLQGELKAQKAFQWNAWNVLNDDA